MPKNIINKNLTIYLTKNIFTQNKLMIIISLKLGWLLFPLQGSRNLQLEPILFGFNRLYKYFFKIKGFGYKWKYVLMLKKKHQSIYFKLGFTHRISLILKKDCKCKLKKKRLILKHRSNTFLRNKLNLLFFLYKTHLYNKKGIYLRGTKFKLKISKKKSKF